jgi:hypothetical protein
MEIASLVENDLGKSLPPARSSGRGGRRLAAAGEEMNKFRRSEQTSEVVQVPKCRTFCAPRVPLSSEGRAAEP